MLRTSLYRDLLAAIPEQPNEATDVYRLYDRDGVLLYVGISLWPSATGWAGCPTRSRSSAAEAHIAELAEKIEALYAAWQEQPQARALREASGVRG